MAQQIQPKTTKIMKLINQGTFGCIFRPGLKCGTKTIDSDKFITKVQVASSEVNTETEIGSIITTIPKYRYRFAPVIETCPIDISTIGSTQISKCEVIAKSVNQDATKTKFVSNKIQYIGKNTLGDYLDKLLVTQHLEVATKPVDKYMKKMIDIHIYLLKSIQLLVNNNIIHYDLKENNIIYDESNEVPIIIDFGLSFQINKLTDANYASAFYTLYEKYPCWCVEIMLLCYITKRVFKNKEEGINSAIKKSALDDMKVRVSTYLYENDAMRNNITEKEKELFKIKTNRFINSFHTKTWKQMLTKLIETYKTWDSYSLAVIMIRELGHTGFISESPNTPFLQDYTKILKNIILSPPMLRPEISDTMVAIKNIFAKVNKNDYANFTDSAGNHLKKPEAQQKIKQRRIENTLTELLYDEELYKRKGAQQNK
jgi:hypothetical protein